MNACMHVIMYVCSKEKGEPKRRRRRRRRPHQVVSQFNQFNQSINQKMSEWICMNDMAGSEGSNQSIHHPKKKKKKKIKS